MRLIRTEDAVGQVPCRRDEGCAQCRGCEGVPRIPADQRGRQCVRGRRLYRTVIKEKGLLKPSRTLTRQLPGRGSFLTEKADNSLFVLR